MKNATMTIKEKIAFLEALNEVLESAKRYQNCYSSYDDNGNECPPTDEYQLRAYNAFGKVIAILEKEV